MLRDKNGDLAEFLSNVPRQTAAQLSRHCRRPDGRRTDQLVEKMDSLGKHVEHIKEIVAMQQSYAKVSGVYETLSVAGLVRTRCE